jgi:hypothetical protein
MTNDSFDRVEIDTHQPGRLRRAWDTLQDTLIQPVQTVTRRATLNTTTGTVEDIDPPEDLDELVALAYDIGFIRKNLSEFTADVTEPGVRVQSPHEPTEAYFMGGGGAPDSAPEGGFITEAYVIDEKRQHINRCLDLTVLDRWRRGTVLVEYVYEDPADPDSKITGFTHIRPETVSARTYENTNQLIAPDDTENADMTTPRDEAAAFVQFDEESILGRRTGRRLFTRDDTSIPLSQNDVLKQTLHQDIGGDDPEAGVFGESIIRSIKDAAEEYRSISRDEAEAIKRMAFGVHTAQFNDYVIDAGDEHILVEWPEEDIDSATSKVEDLKPGEVISTDAKVELERFAPDLPDLDGPMRRRAREIVDPLPAPFYKHSFADEINQFVTEDQRADYQDLIKSERGYQANSWTDAFRDVAQRHPDLQAEGLEVTIEPDEEDSPILSLSDDDVKRIETFASAMADLFGPGGAPSYVDERTLLELILQLPPETIEGDEVDDLSLDEADDEVRAQFEALQAARAEGDG